MILFKKNKIRGKQISELPGYGGRWFLGKENSTERTRKKKRPSKKLPDYPVDTSFVYYDD